MQNVNESGSASDYIYYPINYTTKTLSTVVTMNTPTYSQYGGWVTQVDKEKFLVGICNDYSGIHSLIYLISIGF